MKGLNRIFSVFTPNNPHDQNSESYNGKTQHSCNRIRCNSLVSE